MRLPAFQTICGDCQTQFDNPSHGSMAYGEFIARGEKGTMLAYLPAMGNPGWDRIDKLVEKIFPIHNRVSAEKRFQGAVGKCLDPFDGQALSIVSGPLCPKCHGTSVTATDDVRTGDLEVTDASFSKFLTLDIKAQEEMIRELCRQRVEKGSRR